MFTPASIPNYLPEDGDYYHYMQFTGLKDGEGRDIYEDDIVKMVKDKFSWGKVVYKAPRFVVVDQEGNSYHLDYQLPATRVAGNVHEHPDLLK